MSGPAQSTHPLSGFSTHTVASLVYPDGLTFSEKQFYLETARSATKASNDLWMACTKEIKPDSAELTAVPVSEWVNVQMAKRGGPTAAVADPDAIANLDAAAFMVRMRERVKERRSAEISALRASAAAAVAAVTGSITTPISTTASPSGSSNTPVDATVPLPAASDSTTGLTLGRVLVHATTATSTMTLMTNALYSLPLGTVMVADEQRAGRGRGANTWVSPQGGIMCNVSFPVTEGVLLPFVQYLVGCAVVRAINRHPLSSRLNMRLKWPNDVFMNGRKIGGILCQSSTDFHEGKMRFIVHVGFGINVDANPSYASLNVEMKDIIAAGPNGRIPSEAPPLAGDASKGPTVDYAQAKLFNRGELLADIIAELDQALPAFQRGEIKGLIDEYLSLWLHSGQLVSVEGKTGSFRLTGLSPSGYLRAQSVTDKDEVFELHPDGNSLDMMRGLVAAKKIPSPTGK